ncbi:MAG: DUF4123 domain-containing protein [Massilia sp.]
MSEANILVAPWHPLLEQLHQHFHATTQYQCLLWVDPAQADPFEGFPLVEETRVRTPIRHPRFDPLRAPYVVPLELSRSADADLLRDSVELAWLSWSIEYLSAMRGQPICGWVTPGSTTAKALTGHWGRHCHLHVDQRQAKLLRFQDPGVREWLWTDFSDSQQRAMLGPATGVHAIGRGQQFIHHSYVHAAKPSSHSPNEPGESPALRLNQLQWDQVEDYGVTHAAWLAWRSSRAEEVAVCQGPGWERAVLGALSQATRFGLRDAADRELFALHALRFGAGFYQHQRLQDVWRKTQAGDFYGSALEEITGRPVDQIDAFIHGL